VPTEDSPEKRTKIGLGIQFTSKDPIDKFVERHELRKALVKRVAKR
jgi:hypothetical protein